VYGDCLTIWKTFKNNKFYCSTIHHPLLSQKVASRDESVHPQFENTNHYCWRRRYGLMQEEAQVFRLQEVQAMWAGCVIDSTWESLCHEWRWLKSSWWDYPHAWTMDGGPCQGCCSKRLDLPCGKGLHWIKLILNIWYYIAQLQYWIRWRNCMQECIIFYSALVIHTIPIWDNKLL
jgi:hypothetical protein